MADLDNSDNGISSQHEQDSIEPMANTPEAKLAQFDLSLRYEESFALLKTQSAELANYEINAGTNFFDLQGKLANLLVTLTQLNNCAFALKSNHNSNLHQSDRAYLSSDFRGNLYSLSENLETYIRGYDEYDSSLRLMNSNASYRLLDVIMDMRLVTDSLLYPDNSAKDY